MTSRWAAAALIVMAALGGLALRAPKLALRPLHGDEAVNALKFRDLYEQGRFAYDPAQYHGPSLHYLLLPIAKLAPPGRSWTELSEPVYRSPAVICGVGVILLLLLLRDALSPAAVVTAAILTALSPAMVFYSRYFIHEMLLVLATLGAIAAGWRYARSRRIGWAITAGACLGLMLATKETAVLVFLAMGAGLALARLWGRWVHGEWTAPGTASHLRDRRFLRDSALAAGAAILVCVLLYSDFLTHPGGLLDALGAYRPYLQRARGSLHLHPWYWYFQLLIYPKLVAGPTFTEALIVGLALIGATATLMRRGIDAPATHFARFLTFYTLVLTAAYAAIPYKTPWCVLGPLHGMILLAGIGVAALLTWVRPMGLKVIVVLLIVAAMAQLGHQAYQASFRFYADGRNPWVYAHPSTNVVRLARFVEALADASPQGRDLTVQVATDNFWPLPWYLRRLPNVGWWDHAPEQLTAPIIMTTQDLLPDVQNRLPHPEQYRSFLYGLRPAVVMTVFVRDDVYQAWRARNLPAADAAAIGPATPASPSP